MPSQSVDAARTPVKRVCHHEDFDAGGADFFRRKDARPAINDAAADATERTVCISSASKCASFAIDFQS